MKQIKREFLLPFILLVLLFFLVNPAHFWMPQPLHMSILTALVVVFIVYAVYVWKERAADERENLHKLIAARFAYLAGSLVLITGIVIQALNHVVDFWAVTALSVMIVAKMIGRWYGDSKY